MRGKVPLVSWCRPIFQPFGLAVLDGDCAIYNIDQNFVKGVGCIRIPGTIQVAWLKATVVGAALELVLEIVDVCFLTIVHSKMARHEDATSVVYDVWRFGGRLLKEFKQILLPTLKYLI